MMKALIYLSRNVNFTSDEELGSFIQTQLSHSSSHLTGYLYSDQDYFLHYLEGEAWLIDRLWFKIHADTRHEVIYVTCIYIKQLRFSAWTFKNSTDVTQVEVLLFKYLIQEMHGLAINNFKTKVMSFFNQDTTIWNIVDRIKRITDPLVVKAG